MAVDSLNEQVSADAVQLTFPLLDQVWRRDNQHDLLIADLAAELFDHTRRHRNRG